MKPRLTKEQKKALAHYEFCERQEDRYLSLMQFRIIELRGDRVLIELVDCDYRIPPQECVPLTEIKTC